MGHNHNSHRLFSPCGVHIHTGSVGPRIICASLLPRMVFFVGVSTVTIYPPFLGLLLLLCTYLPNLDASCGIVVCYSCCLRPLVLISSPLNHRFLVLSRRLLLSILGIRMGGEARVNSVINWLHFVLIQVFCECLWYGLWLTFFIPS